MQTQGHKDNEIYAILLKKETKLLHSAGKFLQRDEAIFAFRQQLAHVLVKEQIQIAAQRKRQNEDGTDSRESRHTGAPECFFSYLFSCVWRRALAGCVLKEQYKLT